MASLSDASTSVHVPFPSTSDLKSTRGLFLKTLKRQPPYRHRRHSRVTFSGTVKTHGTNITLLIIPNKSFQIQSRNNIITPDNDDGYRSAAWILPRSEHICDAFKSIVDEVPKEVMIAGEFAGEGINPEQAATSDLEKFYIIFGIRVDGSWVDRKAWEHIRFDVSIRVFNIYEFKTFHVVIDFDEERNVGGGKIVSDLCLEVEKSCPVALQLGGIKEGLGEGIVWTEDRDDKGLPRNPMRFKSKGPKFEVVGKLAPSEQVAANGQMDELKGKAEEFVEYAVTSVRLEQGLESVRETLGRGSVVGFDMDEILHNNGNINRLSNWVKKVVWKEQLLEITEIGLEKGVGKAQVEQLITKKVKKFFLARQEALGGSESRPFALYRYSSPSNRVEVSGENKGKGWKA